MNLSLPTSSTHICQGTHTAVVVARNKPWKFYVCLVHIVNCHKTYGVRGQVENQRELISEPRKMEVLGTSSSVVGVLVRVLLQ